MFVRLGFAKYLLGNQHSAAALSVFKRLLAAVFLLINTSTAIAVAIPLSNVTGIATGGIVIDRHSCAVLSDTSVRCWGANTKGQLGNGTQKNSLTPVAVSGLSGVVQVIAGSVHTCALIAGGTVKCWGDNSNYQLGTPSSSSSSLPVDVGGLSSVTAIATGGYYTCALLSSGSVSCWGTGLGLNNSSTPTSVNGITSAQAIAIGHNHACALLANGSAKCWGLNSTGQLGNGSTTNSSVPVDVSGLSSATKITAGGLHSCAMLNDGGVKCWGWNVAGQLGTGNYADSSIPVIVKGLSGATSISAGGNHTCARLTNNRAVCWGENDSGELGNGQTVTSYVPVSVKGLVSVAILAAGEDSTCALLNTGSVSCWGSDSWGQLGNGVAGYSATPVSTVISSRWTTISSGQDHSCALSDAGVVSCWGANRAGALGNGNTQDSGIPGVVAGLPVVTAISAGAAHTCALAAGGIVYCWGDNSNGQLGKAFYGPSTVPLQVSGIPSATMIASSAAHTCALVTGGAVYCWGANYYGELGNGSTTNSATPTAVQGLTGAVDISSTGIHTCAVMNTGSINCWGFNGNGQLGNGTYTNSSTPVAVNGITNAIAVAAGGYGTCALLGDHTVSCWGSIGPLGPSSTLPFSIAGLTNVSSIAVGGYFACALTGSQAFCWGGNTFGQIGNGNAGSSDVYAPTLVGSLSNISALALGYDYACALQTGGNVWCWGNNNKGQLGTGLMGYFGSPQTVMMDCPTCKESGFVPLSPSRLLDTRPGPYQFTVDGQYLGAGAVAGGHSLDLTVLGRGGVPASGVTAVALNVTVANPTQPGHIRVWPAGSSIPPSSNLNFVAGKTIANMVITKVGVDGKISLFNSDGTTDLIADVVGYFTSASDLTTFNPRRLLDTRAIGTTSDGSFAGIGALGAVSTLDLNVTGRAGIPASGVSTVVLNVTVTGPTAAGYLTVWPSATPLPLASNLNFAPYETIPNLVLAQVGSNGKVSIFNGSTSTDVVADAVGYFSNSEEFRPLIPARILDTRWYQQTIDGQFAGSGPRSGGTTLNMQVWGRGGIPAVGVGAVVLNVTVANPTTNGYLTVWPTGTRLPNSSNINFVPGKTVPNLVIAKVGANGQISIFNSSGATDVIADVVGWFPTAP